MKYLIGFLVGWLGCAVGFITLGLGRLEDPGAMQRELTAYQDCMAQAYRCRMTPQDFVRYHELRHRLELSPEGASLVRHDAHEH